MHTVIVGAGGLGSVVGGYLAKAGYPVTLIGRPAHVKAIRDSGLEIMAVDGRHLIREVQATDNPKTVTAADLLILTVKTYDTDEALKGVVFDPATMEAAAAVASRVAGVQSVDCEVVEVPRIYPGPMM